VDTNSIFNLFITDSVVDTIFLYGFPENYSYITKSDREANFLKGLEDRVNASKLNGCGSFEDKVRHKATTPRITCAAITY